VTDREERLAIHRVREDLHQWGLLPFSDPIVPSLVSIVTGGPISGSWWGHPAGSQIYAVGEALDSDPDLLTVKLWRGKLTLLHRRLWPSLVRIGRARSPWQLAELGRSSRSLLDEIDAMSCLRVDRIHSGGTGESRELRPALRDLERRLLVLTRSVHTDTGAHALEAESWDGWAARVRSGRSSGSVVSAQHTLETAARRLRPEGGRRRDFPWQ
jgi:hypothetical protein